MTAPATRRILILYAMREEARPLIERLSLHPNGTPFARPMPMRAWTGDVAGGRVDLVVNGVDPRFNVDLIGTQGATLAASESIRSLQPDLVISAGTAGGFAGRGAGIGDVYLSRSPIVFHDRRIPLPGFDSFGVGSFHVPVLDGLARETGLRLGVVSTGNALDLPAEDLAMMSTSGADIKDMEAAAVAWIAEVYGVPMFAIKAVTDLVDQGPPPQEQFLQNLELAVELLTDAVERVLKFVIGRPIGSLMEPESI